MHTKGDSAKQLKEKLELDTCIYLGNDLNDISMFSNALDDNDFMVIANNEHEETTKAVVEYLKEECKIKGIDWKDARLLVLEEQNVNRFLNQIRNILEIINRRQRMKYNKEYR